MKNLVIIGAGGFAREVFDLANYCFGENAEFSIKGFLSDDPSDIEDLGYPPVLATVDGYKIQTGDVFHCAIGNVKHRKKCVEIIKGKGGKFINLVHPKVVISPSVMLGEGVAIKAFCVLASDVKIGNFTFLQSAVIMGHDVIVGDFCQINSHSFFAGCARIGDLVTIAAGAKFIQNAVVEDDSIVGVGSVVLRKVRSGTTVFGIPAKVLKH